MASTEEPILTRIDRLDNMSLEKHCRPIDHVIIETEVKGTMIERLDHLEDRMLKIEAEWDEGRRKEEMKRITEKKQEESPKKKKKGLKQFVKHCVNVKANGKHRDNTF